jgi:hypothetical protein
MNEDFIDLIRLSVLAYLGRDEDDGDCRGGLITLLEEMNRYDGSTDFLCLLDTCLTLGAEWEIEEIPPWAPFQPLTHGNVYGFVDVNEDGTAKPVPIPAPFVQKAFSTLVLDDEVSAVIRQLPSNLIDKFTGTEVAGVDVLYFDGTSSFSRFNG